MPRTPRHANAIQSFVHQYQREDGTPSSSLRGVKANMVCQGLAPESLNLFKNLDYSVGRCCPLDEGYLDERRGMGMIPVDWNCDGGIDEAIVVHKLPTTTDNSWCASGTELPYYNLYDHSEWANLQDNTQLLPGTKLDHMPIVTCITVEEYQRQSKILAVCPQPDVTIEPCVGNTMYWVWPYDGHAGVGECADPFRGLVQAQNLADPGGILFLKYGTFNEATPTLRLNKRLTITAVGRASIRPTGVAQE